MFMEKVNKRTIQAQKTKKLIFDQATRLIKEKGFYNVSIEDITSAVGVSVGTFYYYFQNKDDLVLLWADDLDQQYSDYYKKETSRKKRKNVLEILEGILDLSMAIYSGMGAEFATVSYSYIMRNSEANERFTGSFRVYRQIIRNLINEGREKGLIRDDMSVESMVQNFYKATRGGIMDWCVNGSNKNIKEFTRDFLRCFLDGIKPQKQQ